VLPFGIINDDGDDDERAREVKGTEG